MHQPQTIFYPLRSLTFNLIFEFYVIFFCTKPSFRCVAHCTVPNKAHHTKRQTFDLVILHSDHLSLTMRGKLRRIHTLNRCNSIIKRSRMRNE